MMYKMIADKLINVIRENNQKYDIILSIGQVIPHGVVGMANYTKNIVVGCGGEEIINKSHFLGALTGIEKVLGKGNTSVRKLYDHCQKKYLSDAPIIYMLTVNSTEINPKTSLTDIKGIFIGKERDVYEKAVKLSQKENIIKAGKPLKKPFRVSGIKTAVLLYLLKKGRKIPSLERRWTFCPFSFSIAACLILGKK